MKREKFAPEWSRQGEPLSPGKEPKLSKRVRGCAFDMPEGIYIPMVRAVRPGRGDVSKFLDTLPTRRRVVFPNVISEKLRAMLARRGFMPTTDNGHDVMERCAMTREKP